jgi:hypothetical protein
LLRRDEPRAAWAWQSYRLAQCEVEKKAKQIRNQRRDQRPEDGRHGTASRVGVDVTETENPDRDQRAGEQTHANTGERFQHRRYGALADDAAMDRSSDQPNEHSEADYRASGYSNWLRHDIQKFTTFHMTCPFLFADRAEMRSSAGSKRAKHQEGAIQKVNNPA